MSQSQQTAGLGDQHDARSFGAHVRSLRRVRGLTQDQLAERSDLATDTIRRMEHGAFSPSLDTITKLCGGLGLLRSTLFEAFELGERAPLRELTNLACARSDADIEMAIAMMVTLFDQLDRQRAALVVAPEE